MKQLSTILTALAVLLLCLFLLPTEAEAAEIASGTCGNNVTWVLDDSGTLTISGTGAIPNYTNHGSSSAAPWMPAAGVIKSVIIEKGVTSIGGCAFYGCTELSSITIPDSVTSIDAGAFASCSGLTSINIPNSVTSIGNYAFAGCTGLTSVTIPNSVTGISSEMFYGCTGLTSVTIPNSVRSIGSDAFRDCTGLTSITIPNSVNSISWRAFVGCSGLTSVTIPNSVTSIGNNAFSGCTRLTSVTIPNSVTSIGSDAFSGCTSMTGIWVDRDNANYSSDEMGALFDKGKLILLQFPAAFVGHYTVPNNVFQIGECAFANCEGLTTITIPKSVTRFYECVFEDCENLWHVLYKGTEADWNDIYIDKDTNREFLGVTRHYNCTGNESIDLATKTCTICQANCTHNWDSGTVIKAATCKEEGSATYTCPTCNATKTEAIAKLTTHTYGGWTKVDNNTHKHTCSVCSKEETANHNWDSGTITKQATCKEEGVKTKTCTTCSATKTEAIAKLTTHTYDNDCDTACNVCGKTRTVTHKYSTIWSKDKDSHWHVCSVCAKVADKAAHTPGAAATETTAQTCTTCGYVIKAALGHTHKFDTAWSKDASGHWHACACGAQDSYAAHNYKNSCDTDCDICGQTRTITHTPGPAATPTTDQVCTICGKVLNPATGEVPTVPPTDAPTEPPTEGPTEPPTEPTTESTTEPTTESTTEPSTNAPTEPTNPSNSDDGSDSTVIIVAVVAALAGAGVAGGAAVGIILWKKKH